MEYLGEGGLNDIRSRIFKRAGQVTLDSNGEAVIAFGNTVILDREPYVNLTARIGAGEMPVIANIIDGTFTTDANGYTGVTIRGARLRELPATIPLVSALAQFRVWDESDASGVKIDWMVF